MFLWDDRRPRHGWEQMAIDRALLDLADDEGLVLLRLYRWQEDTISFGANESTARHWRRDLLEAAGVATVRRPSGGRAVWHDATDLTYAVVQPVEGIPGARAAYRQIHSQLAEALAQLGAQTGLAPAPPRSPGLGGGSCFDLAAGGEVLVGGRKAIGSAQLVHRRALLQHGEIARTERHHALARFARNGGDPIPAVTAAGLPDADSLTEAILRCWRDEGATAASPALIARCEERALPWQARFRDTGWTWRR